MSIFWAALFYPVNDITTTPEKPPQFIEIAKLEANKDRDMNYLEASKTRQQELYQDLSPLPLHGNPESIFKKIVALSKKQSDWNIIRADDANFRLEAVATTALLKFSDDIVIEVRPDGKNAVVHMRSKSRLGKSDLGANYKRIKAFLNLAQKL